jgi:hypothetical protein
MTLNRLTRTQNAAKHQSGQAIILMAFMIIALMGMLGLAIDGGGLFFLHRDTQNAVDAAIVAATYAKCAARPGTPANTVNTLVQEAAIKALKDNGFIDQEVNNKNGPEGGNADIGVDPAYPSPHSGATDYIRIDLTAYKTSYFIQLLYREQLEVTTSAVGHCRPAGGGLIPENAGIISWANNDGSPCNTNTTGTQVQGSAEVHIYNTGIFVNSSGSCNIRNENGAEWTIDDECQFVGSPDTSMDPDENPCPSTDVVDPQLTDMNPLSHLERPDCGTARDNPGGGPQNPPRGDYRGKGKWNLNASDDYTLEKGIYCLDGISINGNARLYGDGVVFYFPEGNDGISGNGGDIYLRAPTSGLDGTCEEDLGTCEWSGLLIWSDVVADLGGDGDVNDIIQINGGDGNEWHGMIYAPGNSCDLQGNGETKFFGVLACWQVNIQGNSDTEIYYERPEFLYTPPSVEIAQ